MTKPTPTTTIAEFLTIEEITRAVALYETAPIGEFAKMCDKQIITPVLPRIEAKLKQRMHPRYVAYMVEYALMRSGGKP